MMTYAERLARVGFCLDPKLRLSHEDAEALTNREITPRLADMAVQGSRLIVVLDPPDEKVGHILMPETVTALQQKAAGFILAVGPQAGRTQLTSIGNIEVEEPEHLLGLRIVFSRGAIKVLKTSIYDDDYKSEVALISVNDIWMVDTNPNPHQADREFKDSFDRKMRASEAMSSSSIRTMREEIADRPTGTSPSRIIS